MSRDLPVIDSFRRSGRRHRRIWSGRGHAHIEVRTATRAGSEALAEHLSSALRAIDGVHWAEVNGVLGRVVIAFDGDSVDVDDLVEVVEAIEEAHDVHRERFSFDRPEHPGDPEHARRAAAALLADVAGIGLSVLGAGLRLTPIPIELASLVTIFDSEPRLRRLFEEAVGAAAADITLAGLNAVAQAAGQGPLGLLVDGVHRTELLREALARRHAWEQVADQLVSEATAPRPPRPATDRPAPLPPGPIESYADRAGLASILGAGATLAATGNPRRAAGVFLAGVPKVARLGRATFAAEVGRVFSQRGYIVVEGGPLRRFDRIDTVCIEAEQLLTGLVEVDRLEAVGDADHLQLQQRLRTLFDRAEPDAVRRRGGWAIGPLDLIDAPRPIEVRRAMRRLGTAGRVEQVYGVAQRGAIVAVFSVVDELAAGASALVDAVRGAGSMAVVAGGRLDLVGRLGADLWVEGGDQLDDSIRMLQADECCVALFARQHVAALQAADVAVATLRPGALGVGADLLIPDGLSHATFVVEAMSVAHEVSRQSAALAAAGSSIGSLIAVTGRTAATGRAMTSVNLAALAGLVNTGRAAFLLGRHRTVVPTTRPPWHEMSTDEVLERLGSSRQGLSPGDAAGRRGPAAAALSAPFRFGQAVARELANPLTPVLAGGAALSAAVGSVADASMIGAVTGFNALLGATQSLRAEHAVAALQRTTATSIAVLRAGRPTEVLSDELVPGSVILVHAGSVVPADVRILEANGLEVDESSLTGESLPVSKGPDPCMAGVVAERTSMLYEGTIVVAGTATGVVVAVGEDTEAAAGLGATEPPSTAGVEARLAQLSAMTLPFAAVGGLGVVASGMLRGQPLSRSLGAGVSLAVAAVPEGLPVLATLAQLSAARRLSQRGALVRNPRAIEALGRVEVLCTDKTGTLTEGRIRLHSVSDGRTTRALADLDEATRAVIAAARRASPVPNGHGSLAHPTDQATLDGADRGGVDEATGAPGWERLDELPFDPSHGYHLTVGSVDGGHLATVKGAPEVVLPLCRSVRTRRGSRRLDAVARRGQHDLVVGLASKGLRVLAVAERRLDAVADASEDTVADLELLGYVAFADPVRESAAAAVAGLRRAGVDIVMVTGDHPSTAESIAAELGILNGHRVLTGAELNELDDPALEAVLPTVSVFARIAPADKVRIVGAYQRLGRTVAMTGDGANDAPAIRLADAGIALGSRSTPAARSAADVVITDDRIETVVDAIIEGRAMWGSVRDALAILLGGNLGEIGFTVGASALTGRSPLSSRQILLVNLLTDVAPALAIAVRPPQGSSYDALVAEGPDRSLGAKLDRAILARALTTASGAGAAWAIASLSGTRRRASTVGLVALVGTQLGQTLTTGGTHPTVLLAALGSSAALAAIVQTPGVSQMFGCTPLDPLAWATAVGSAVTATGVSWAAPHLLRALAPASDAEPDTVVSPPTLRLVVDDRDGTVAPGTGR